MRLRLVLFLALAVLLLGSACLAQPQRRQPLTVTRYADVRATVLSVTRLSFPYSRVTLDIRWSGDSRIYDLRRRSDIVTAESYFWRTIGRVDCGDRRNIGALAAYYLLPGDEISAKLFPGTGLGPQWYIYGIARLGRGVTEPTFPRSATRVYDDLRLSLTTDRQTYRPDQTVRMTLEVRNVSDRTSSLTFPSSQKYDFIVREDNRDVWRWSQGKFFTQALTTVRLAPGEVIRYTETWDQRDQQRRRVGAGNYDINAVLTISDPTNRPSVGPVTITIQDDRDSVLGY